MSQITIKGHRDDILILDGALYEEMYPSSDACSEDKPDHLALSDGTLLSVVYDKDGIWRICLKTLGKGTLIQKVEGTLHPDTGSDVVTLTNDAPWKWALLASTVFVAPKG